MLVRHRWILRCGRGCCGFSRGGNFQFLQLVLGYLVGRIVIAVLFIPSYFKGELLTVYQLLDRRFGVKIKMIAASLFVIATCRALGPCSDADAPWPPAMVS